MLPANRTIADIVRADYRAADVFTRHGINFYYEGNTTLEEICRLNNIDARVVENEISAATQHTGLPDRLQFNDWKISFLIDYICNIHHAFLHKAIPAIEAEISGMLDPKKPDYKTMVNINGCFLQLSSLLLKHIPHEEEIIFPYIKQLETTYSRKETYGSLFVRTLRKPLSNITKEEEDIVELLNRLQQYTSNYTAQSNKGADMQLLYQKLHEFHNDCIQHLHLENNILFPKAIEIEQQLLRN